MSALALPTAAESALRVSSDEALRCAFYCEENVWRLAYRKRQTRHHRDGEEFHVAFISNARKCVPMFYQRASASPADKPCSWDYHVILIGVIDGKGGIRHSPLVYDVDTTLSYPVNLVEYLNASFSVSFPECYAPLFRLVTAEHYLAHFGSDRRHMYDATTSQWTVAPPSYRCILPTITTCDARNVTDENERTTRPSCKLDDAPVLSIQSNLADYLDFNHATTAGNVQLGVLGTFLTLQQLQHHW